MVASSAKISRDLAPGACGDVARALATKSAISLAVDDLASGRKAELSA
jgi:RNA processing factor Prp31